ncbi:putative DNA modification/repair radical SAM protein [Corallococcus sp. BB11-1]|uniref:putative DNA modification/repair radical SAM protein n=1 Tax=Corallococcus sp. BB11-1 TaxID=2996783 RepID=UPI00226ED860|nr:putative DNA modification/repair radical SAM protein [Corallococcus sp. BB11-1]MCY1030294.1 putative DNA modification/repair radical SAM protein [Corallococcus sp. BB11-1]
MDVRKKLEILADAAKYDASCSSSGGKRKAGKEGLGSVEGMGICHSYTPDGRCVSLLKILLTNFCIYDCQYCINRISSDTARARFTPAEVVQLTLDFYKRNYIEGLFLSSGVIKSPDYTMEQLIQVTRTLREVHGFQGYIHLKAVPGASRELIDKAGRYADRLSANIELPTDSDLKRLAPEKSFAVTGGTMKEISARVEQSKAERMESPKAPKFAPAGQSTQMIVGATPTPDAAILDTASRLYTRFKLRRVYYSAYSPIPLVDARLPAKSPPLVREHRLYQADWLLRFYGFRVDELAPPEQPDLSLEMDPKLAWALRRREAFPMDVNRAPREALLRVPGMGVRTVDRLIRIRRWHRITLADLARLRVPLARMKPFIVTADHRPTGLIDSPRLAERVTPPATQLSLFTSAQEALTGEL